MSTVLSPLPIQKFFDNNGQPLANGKLFTYKAATSTKQATYIDSTGGTPNTNPVILDYRGECRLWIDPTLAYQFVLAPSTDTDPPANPFWSVDNITAFGTGVNFDNTAIDTGSVNAITVAIPSISAPVAFTRIVVKVANTNTGATTISINGGTAKAVTLKNIAALTGNELQANGIYIFIFDGAQWQLESPALQPPQIRTPAEIAASVTPINYWIPSHEQCGIFYPLRYGAAGDANSSGTTGTDDTVALQNMALVINQVGGGTVSFRPGAYYRVFSATTGALFNLSNLRGINIQGNGCTLVVPTSKTITTAEGYFFAFTNCKNITVNGFNTNGPTLDVSNTNVKGYEFTHYVGCDTIDMPANTIVNALAGATFYGQNGSGFPDASSRSQNIHIGVMKVTNCWYGIDSQFSGDNLVCDMLVSDTIHRSVFIYGCSDVKINVHSKNHKATDLRMFAWNDGTHGSQPLKNVEVWYSTGTDSTACGANVENIYTGAWGTGPCVYDTIKIHLDIEYAGSGQGGAAVAITKLNNSAAADPTGSRGHTFSNITIDGRVLGIPDTSANGIVALDSNANFTGETLSGTWRFAVMTNASTSYNTLSLAQCSGMGANTTLDISGMNASAPAQIPVQESAAALELPHNPRIVHDGINCTNRYANVSGPVLALEYMNAGSATPTAYAGWCFGTRKWLTTRNSGGTTTWALPAATVGMRIGLIRTDAVVARWDPNGTEVIRGGGAGKYFQTNVDGSNAILRCDTAGTWEIEQQQGTWTFEP